MTNRWDSGNSDRLYFQRAAKSLQMVTAAIKLKDTPWKKNYDKPRHHIKKQRHYFAKKGPSSQSYVFPVVMCGCESWTLKKAEHQKWRFWTVVLERTLESLLDCKEIQPVHPKGNQSWICVGRTDAEADTPILWLPDAKNCLIGKKSWCWERLKVGGEGEDRGWDGWMASSTWWTSWYLMAPWSLSSPIRLTRVKCGKSLNI